MFLIVKGSMINFDRVCEFTVLGHEILFMFSGQVNDSICIAFKDKTQACEAFEKISERIFDREVK